MTDPTCTAIEELAEAVARRRVILFVGAGASMCVGLPSWQDLIQHMTHELGLDLSESRSSEDTYQTLAEFYRLKKGGLGDLVRWMSERWAVCVARVARSEVHRLLVELDFPLICTSNYDRNLEAAFELYRQPFVRVSDVRDVAKAGPEATQIIKLHGDFGDEKSLVLTESDYFSRLTFDSPLDIKFRADALGQSVLFIGYSMSDLNIRLLLHRLWETWHQSGFEADRPRSYVFEPCANPVQAAVLSRWGIVHLHGHSDDPEQALCAFLRSIARVRNRLAA